MLGLTWNLDAVNLSLVWYKSLSGFQVHRLRTQFLLSYLDSCCFFSSCCFLLWLCICRQDRISTHRRANKWRSHVDQKEWWTLTLADTMLSWDSVECSFKMKVMRPFNQMLLQFLFFHLLITTLCLRHRNSHSRSLSVTGGIVLAPENPQDPC